MKLERVNFISVVSFGGSLRSASTKVSGANPGEGGTEISLTDDNFFVVLTKRVNGQPKTVYVPMTNISSLEPAVAQAAPKAEKK